MKKIFSIILAFAMTIMLTNAQTVEKSGLFENTYVTVSGGVVSNTQFGNFTKDNWYKVSPSVGLELGKYITPVVGFSVEGIGLIGTTTSRTFFDESVVLGNGKLNFSNWFGGYPGQPRRVEVTGVLGYGWGHDYAATSYGQYRANEGIVVINERSDQVVGKNGVLTDKNYTVYKAGAELNVNLGKERAWQINFRPSVLWFHKEAGNFISTPFITTKRDARFNVQLGVTYKFGNRAKGHNFRLCPYSVTRAEYDELFAKYSELVNRGPEIKEVYKTITETKEVVVHDTKVLVGSTVITFGIGSVALTPTERAKVELFAESLDNDTLVQIVGSADSKTGSETRNFALAQRRAEVVKNILTNDYGIAEDRIETLTRIDATKDVNTSRSAILTLNVR